MRVRRIAPGVWTGISGVWQTTYTICGPGGALVIDGPVLPAELSALAMHARPQVLIATHGDWDHLLAPLAFPDADRRAGQATIDRLGADGHAIAQELAAWDRARALPPRQLPDWRHAALLDAPAVLGSPIGPVQIAPTPGHTRDGIAVLLTGPGILVTGDYVSPCEIPSLSTDTRCQEYLDSLDRLERLLRGAHAVVPGHGWPVEAARARVILAEDRRYVDAVASGRAPRLPRHAADPTQQAQHRANLAAAREG